VGPGAGTGLTIFIGGIIAVLLGIMGYAIESIRDIETIMPDHETASAPKPA
jgi:hypothetical protein